MKSLSFQTSIQSKLPQLKASKKRSKLPKTSSNQSNRGGCQDEKVTKFFFENVFSILAGGQIILANSSIMECEEFILSEWSPPDDPAMA